MDRKMITQREDRNVADRNDNAGRSTADDDNEVGRTSAAVVHQTISYDADDEKSFVSNVGSVQQRNRDAAKVKKSRGTP